MTSLRRWHRGVAAVAFVAGIGAPARAQDQLWTALGDQVGDDLGYGVVAIGDVDFDGVDDVVATESSWGQLTRVFSGRSGAKLYDIALVGGTPKRLGDVNGDGRADFIFEGLGSSVRSGKGGALLYYVTARFTIAVGDVDGDAIADFAGQEVVGLSKPLGEVRILSGVDGHLIRTIAPAGRGPEFGWGLAPVGDRDGDGVADLAVTVDGPVAATIGRIAIYSLASGALLASSMNVGASSSSGPPLAAAGDLDGDGFVDLVCSSDDATVGGNLYAGQVDVLSTGAMQVLATFHGDAPFDFFHAEGVVGDIDGDGFEDFVLATFWGTTHECWSGRTFRRLYSLQHFYGWSAGVGRGADLDGDGRTEFCTGEPDTGYGIVAVERGRRAFLTVDPKYRWNVGPSGWPTAAGELDPMSAHFFGANLQPGGLVTLVLTEVDGGATGIVVAAGLANSFGEWGHAIVVPPDGYHHDLGFVLVGHDRNGQAFTTAPERVSYD